MNENEKNMPLTPDIQMLIAGHIPNTKYFDSRFDHLQFQSDELRRNQESFREQARDLKLDMDRKFADVDKHFGASRQDMLERFTQVDKRFEQVDKRFEQVDKRFEQVDKRFDEFRSDMKERFEQVDKRFEQVDKRFEQVDKRFEQVDKRLERVIASIDNLGSKLDKRDEQHKSFTLRMFSLAITISLCGVLGVFFKSLGMI
jgi:chromosome segregation ATPase